MNPLETSEDYCRKLWMGETNYISLRITTSRDFYLGGMLERGTEKQGGSF